MIGDFPGRFAGVRIIEDLNCLDWTETPYPRSPARAKRRAARGFPQHMRRTAKPSRFARVLPGGGTMIMHPAMAQALRKAIPERPRSMWPIEFSPFFSTEIA